MSGFVLHIILCLFSLWQPEQLPYEDFVANHDSNYYFDFVFDSITDSTSPIDLNDEKKHKAVFPIYKDSHFCYLKHVPLCIYCAIIPISTTSIPFESDTSPPAFIHFSQY